MWYWYSGILPKKHMYILEVLQQTTFYILIWNESKKKKLYKIFFECQTVGQFRVKHKKSLSQHYVNI